mmetsp:Transcript_36913/g.60023  ORF Transcript_36913/g.60023 Transcript_36913/m.60023 type:complete len:269 (-) Transcript_36913:795-1601(-)
MSRENAESAGVWFPICRVSKELTIRSCKTNFRGTSRVLVKVAGSTILVVLISASRWMMFFRFALFNAGSTLVTLGARAEVFFLFFFFFFFLVSSGSTILVTARVTGASSGNEPSSFSSNLSSGWTISIGSSSSSSILISSDTCASSWPILTRPISDIDSCPSAAGSPGADEETEVSSCALSFSSSDSGTVLGTADSRTFKEAWLESKAATLVRRFDASRASSTSTEEALDLESSSLPELPASPPPSSSKSNGVHSFFSFSSSLWSSSS